MRIFYFTLLELRQIHKDIPDIQYIAISYIV